MRRCEEGDAGREGDDPLDPLGLRRRELDRPPDALAAEPDQDSGVGAGGGHDGLDVAGDPLAAVGVGIGRAVRPPVATPVEGDDAVRSAQVGDLALPLARVDDRVRGQQDDGRLARPVDLVGDADAVGRVGDAAFGRQDGPARIRRRVVAGAALRRLPGRGHRRSPPSDVDEVAEQQVDHHRVAGVGEVARPLEDGELAVRQLREPRTRCHGRT